MNWQEELLYLGYANGAVAIYNLDSRTFVLQPALLHPDLGAVWNATFDKSTSTSHLAFLRGTRTPYLYYIKLSRGATQCYAYALQEVGHDLPAMATRAKHASTSTPTQQLVVLYFHSQRQYQGGRANIYNTKDIPTLVGQLAKPLKGV